MILFLSPVMDKGEKGVKYGTVNDSREQIWIIIHSSTNIIPIVPINTAPIMKNSLYHLSPLVISGSVKISADKDVRAIMIIIMGDTIPAFTVASPNIRAPTVDRALVVKVGLLRSHSLSISKENIMINASINVGNGTDILWDVKLTNSLVGNIS